MLPGDGWQTSDANVVRVHAAERGTAVVAVAPGKAELSRARERRPVEVRSPPTPEYVGHQLRCTKGDATVFAVGFTYETTGALPTALPADLREFLSLPKNPTMPHPIRTLTVEQQTERLARDLPDADNVTVDVRDGRVVVTGVARDAAQAEWLRALQRDLGGAAFDVRLLDAAPCERQRKPR